jgi:hypothetical protein
MVFADRVLDGLGETFRDRAGALVDPLVEGLTAQLQATDDLTTPVDPGGWGTVFDLDTTTLPGWLGTVFGTTVPGGLTVAEQRAYVRDRAAWRRGSCLAMVSAVQALLGGDKLVQLVERVDTAWRLSIRVLASEATGATDEQILAAALTQKPVGLFLVDVERWSALTYDGLAAEHDTYDDLELDFDSYAELMADQDGIADWFRRPGRAVRYARMTAIAPTYTDLAVMFPTYADMRVYEQEI